MNKRILELAELAGARFGGISPVKLDYSGIVRFAELIIQECQNLTIDYKNDQHYYGWLDHRNAIKEHFEDEE